MTLFRAAVPAFLLAALMLAALSLHPLAQAAQAGDTDAAPAKAAESAKPKAGGKKAGSKQKTKPLQDSAETPAERKARLQRECRGAVNAGACSGYTN